ncbi:MAG: BsuPI-related putative proteinase inhibitor [Bryobacteraceae bacterium]
MPGRRIFTISLALASLPAAAGQDYFPLHVGNQWVYRASGTRGEAIVSLEITRAAEIEGRTYWLLRGLPQGEFWLRMDEEGNLWARPSARGQEELWYAFQKPEGEEYRTTLPGAFSRALIASRKAAYKGPIGEVDCALEIQYPGVFQVGIERELFLPYIGMVHRRERAGGPAVGSYDLIYSRTGGVTVLSAPELSFSLTLDSYVYANLTPRADPARVPPTMTARLTLRNTTETPVDLVWPSGQRYDFQIRTEKGDVLWRWSDGKAFTLLYGKESFAGERNYTELIPLADASGQAYPEGKYVLEGWLATQPRSWFATAPFQIRHLQ